MKTEQEKILDILMLVKMQNIQLYEAKNRLHDIYKKNVQYPFIVSDEYICRASCEAAGIDYDDEDDIYDAIRLKIWSEGAKWMRDRFSVLSNLKHESEKESSSSKKRYVFREVVYKNSKYYEIGERDNARTHVDLWCDRRVCEGFWEDREMVVKVVSMLNNL